MTCGWDWAGSKWWKFDCHCHTPKSRDYGKGDRQSEYQQIAPKDWLLDYMRAEVDCIAIMDHNTGEWVDTLKQALMELESEHHAEFRKLYIFPGVEISVNGGCHVLALLPPDKSSNDISALLGAVGYSGTYGDTDGVTGKSYNEVIAEIVKAGGIPIPAHVDQKCGLFTTFNGVTLAEIINSHYITAMCLRDSSFQKPEIYNSSKRNWSEIIGSDSHHPSDSNGTQKPGSHYTWVKMTKPSFEGLRLALLDGTLSLKRSDIQAESPNIHGHLVFTDINISESKYMGRESGRSFSIKLNPWLNTIIGGRGTGKSSILEFMRNPLKRRDNIPSELNGDLSKYSVVYGERGCDGLLLDKTVISIDAIKDGIKYRLSWDVESKNIVLKELKSSGDWEDALGDIRQRFPVRIYSQKQIFELAKNSQALLKVIDESDSVSYSSWRSDFDDLVSKYMSLSLQVREARTKIDDESSVRGNLSDVNRKLAILEQGGHSELVKMHQLRLTQQKKISEWHTEIVQMTDAAVRYSEECKEVSFEISDLNEQHIDMGDLSNSIDLLKNAMNRYRLNLKDITVELKKASDLWIRSYPDFAISKAIKIDEKKYSESLERLSGEGIDASANLDSLFKQKEALEEKIKSIEQRKVDIEKYIKQRDDVYTKIIELRSSLTEKRRVFLAAVLSDNQYLNINVIPYSSNEGLEGDIRGLINCEKGFDKYLNDESDESILKDIVTENDKFVAIESLKRLIWDIFSSNQNVVSKYDSRFVSRIQGMTPEQLDRLFVWFPDDALDVKYRLGNSRKLEPIQHASPGQKTSALLSFILSYGNEPLIIDQPEDDLDNRLIYDLIVKHIRQIKLVRQIIIVTHNANIVVNGDAENIIALDVHNGQTVIYSQGSLQDADIRSSICSIMEGGEEALEQRYRRIKCR